MLFRKKKRKKDTCSSDTIVLCVSVCTAPAHACFLGVCIRVCALACTQVHSIRENLAMYKIGFAGWLLVFTQPASPLRTETIAQITLNFSPSLPRRCARFPSAQFHRMSSILAASHKPNRSGIKLKPAHLWIKFVMRISFPPCSRLHSSCVLGLCVCALFCTGVCKSGVCKWCWNVSLI